MVLIQIFGTITASDWGISAYMLCLKKWGPNLNMEFISSLYILNPKSKSNFTVSLECLYFDMTHYMRPGVEFLTRGGVMTAFDKFYV